MSKSKIKQRLEYLRGELQAERISYDELHELQSLAEHIEPGDVQLLEAAGVPEFPEDAMLEALHFYANPDNWKEQETGIGMTLSEVEADYGSRARDALLALEKNGR
jgi:hypothetical protein